MRPATVRRRLLRVGLLAFLLVQAPPGRVAGEFRQTPDHLALSTPEAAWEVILPGLGFTLQAAGPRRAGRGHYYFFTHAATGLNVSCTLEPASRCTTGRECRDAFWRDPPPATQPAAAVRFVEVNGFAAVEFLVPEFQGVPVRQLNLVAHQVRDGTVVTLHISKAQFASEDRATFLRYLEEVQFAPKPRAP